MSCRTSSLWFLLRIFVCAVCLGTAAAAPTAESLPLTTILVPLEGTTAPVPWTVHADTAFAYAAPDRGLAPAITLTKGEDVSGEVLLREDTAEEWLEFTRDEKIYYVSSNFIHRIHPANRASGNIPVGAEVIDRWWGLPHGYEPTDLEDVPAPFTDGRPYRLRHEANQALSKMLTAARAEGVKLRILSSYRSGARQMELYTKAIVGNPGQRHTAPPGHSEHQLGTTVDLEDSLGKQRLSRRFDMTPEGRWLQENGWKYGWVQSYTPDQVEQTGYIAEPWHWRYWGLEKAKAVHASRQPASTAIRKPGLPPANALGS